MPAPPESGPLAGVQRSRDTPALPQRADQGRGADPLILVAEDNVVSQQVIAEQLALLGYRAELADDGEEALDLWRRGRFALLLTDLQMPGMDGCTLAATVRAEESDGPRLPIIALTANHLRDEELRCRAAGMDGCLAKPVRLSQLKEVIAFWLHPAQPLGAGEAPEATARPAADLRVLAELVGDDPPVMRDVLRAFGANAARLAADLAHAQAVGDARAIANNACQLKSAASAIGAERLGQTCADLEAAAGSVSHSGTLPELMAAFETELHAVQRFLVRYEDGLRA